MILTKQNSLDIAGVAERYDVNVSTIARWLLMRKLPAPHRPFNKRLWLLDDLDLFDQWMHERSIALANGRDPDEVLRPDYSIPVAAPIKHTLCDGK